MFDFNSPTDRISYSDNRKWDKYKGKDVLPLWIADSDFQTAPVIVDALQEVVSRGIFGYANQPNDNVTKAIIGHLDTQHNWTVQADWIVPLNNIATGLSLSCLITDNEGDEILVPSTIYPPFNFVIHNTQRDAIRVPMKVENERWLLDFDALEASITAKTKMLLFCNPHNPGGVVYTKQELTELHRLCEKHNLIICSDEIHCDLVLDEDKKHLPIAALNDDARERTITLMAASKTFNIAGLGFGFAIIPNEGIRKRFVIKIRERLPDVNLLAQVATAAAFSQGEPWRKALIEHLRNNRDYLFSEINAIAGLKMYPLESTFLAWVDVSALKLSNTETFFEAAGVGISAGADFGDNDFIRINFACQKSVLEEAVKRIKKAIANKL